MESCSIMALEPQAQVYDVQIGGYSLKLKTSHKPDQVEKMVQFVEGKVSESLKSHSNISIQKALILSCLNIAEDYIHLREGVFSRLGPLESKAESLAQTLKSDP